MVGVVTTFMFVRSPLPLESVGGRRIVRTVRRADVASANQAASPGSKRYSAPPGLPTKRRVAPLPQP